MQKNSSNSSEEWRNNLGSHFNPEDRERLFNYPSVGQLFSEDESNRFEDFSERMKSVNENLERVIRHGSRTDAEKAERASQAVKITLEFLQNLKQTSENE